MTAATEIFARRLNEERQRAGLSQAALAARITDMIGRSIDPSAIARAEKHERAIRLDEAVAIADALQVPLTSLLRDRDAIDYEIDELRRDLSLYQWKLSKVEEEAQQAADSISATRRRIEELEAARGE
ncbi:helix-turn-helix transcriptional regulator [Arthrobacter sp. zg-Y40]|uniref:helix-turn-helix domain-containing protein n=1 Tax=Arthrobacter sp. zg-Y40 TaxID=2886939 RepID=UPI001D13D613|nr:helix-turn-helix transcriptional regulator [Arthrobacter sp. zg-Y40]MCC3278167.1 helix-turn-helix transcriptional regulator [Arthrobacter sp. zg-Y40]